MFRHLMCEPYERKDFINHVQFSGYNQKDRVRVYRTADNKLDNIIRMPVELTLDIEASNGTDYRECDYKHHPLKFVSCHTFCLFRVNPQV